MLNKSDDLIPRGKRTRSVAQGFVVVMGLIASLSAAYGGCVAWSYWRGGSSSDQLIKANVLAIASVVAILAALLGWGVLRIGRVGDRWRRVEWWLLGLIGFGILVLVWLFA